MLNKEEQYSSLYFPLEVIDEKKKIVFGLWDIGSNISKLFVSLMPSIMIAIKKIKEAECEAPEYEWKIVVTKKKKKKR